MVVNVFGIDSLVKTYHDVDSINIGKRNLEITNNGKVIFKKEIPEVNCYLEIKEVKCQN